jgi:hypothetical protein
MSVEELLAKMQRAAERFDVAKVEADEVKAAAGYASDED